MRTFKEEMTEIFNAHLECEFWEDECPAGKSSGCNHTMSHWGDIWTVDVMSKDEIAILLWNEDEQEHLPYIMTDEETKFINDLIEDIEIWKWEEHQEAVSYSRDGPMKHYGMSWRDFI